MFGGFYGLLLFIGPAEKLIDSPDRLFNFAWSHDNNNLAVARGRQSAMRSL